MENASKALLIAASVLIVIILITGGILIVNSSNKTIAEASNAEDVISSHTASASTKLFNVQFEKYFGS